MIRLFRISIPSSAVALVLSETILVLSCYVVAAYATLDIATSEAAANPAVIVL